MTHARAFGLLGLVLLAVGASVPARAWGDEGHEIIGHVAAHFLEPAVRQRVLELLATDASGLTADTGIAAESTWADHYRDSDRASTRVRYLGTRQWHFVDLELAGADPDAACFGHPPLAPGHAASEGPAAACIIDKIEQFRSELAAPRTAPAERRLALEFLLHLVGDLHQPLHAADDHDQGGNAKTVRSGAHAPGTLHHYWDTVFVADLGRRAESVAATLIGEIPAAAERDWSAGTPRSWAIESYAIAREHCYGRLPPPAPDGLYVLAGDYASDADTVVRGQLERAGVRLAALLNEALR